MPHVLWSPTDFSGSLLLTQSLLALGSLSFLENRVSLGRILPTPQPLSSSTTSLPMSLSFLPSVPSAHGLIFSVTALWLPHLIFSSLALLPIFNSRLIPLRLKLAFYHFALTILPSLGPVTFLFTPLRVPGSTPITATHTRNPSPVSSSVVLLWQTQVLVQFNSLPTAPLLWVTKYG